MDVEEYNSSTGICDWPDRFFAEIVQQFLQTSSISTAYVGQAPTYVLDAKQLVEFAIPIMVAEAKRLSEKLL